MSDYNINKPIDWYKGNDILHNIITGNVKCDSRVDCDIYKRFLYRKNNITNDEFGDAMGYYEHSEIDELVSHESTNLLSDYVNLDIIGTFGISYLEFISLPIEDLITLYNKAGEIVKMKADKMSGINKELEDAGLLE